MAKKKYITCRNRNLKKRSDHHYDLRRRDLDAGCMNCPYMKSHKGQHYTDDWARCSCPLEVKFGDKIETIPEQVRIVRKYKKRTGRK